MKICFILFVLLNACFCLQAAPKVSLSGSSQDKALALGDDFSVTLSVAEGDEHLSSGEITLKIYNSWGEVIWQKKQQLAAGNPATFACKINAPGVYIAMTEAYVDAQGKAAQPEGGHPLYAVACAPEQIQAGAPEPKDFDAFWAKAVSQYKDAPVVVEDLPADMFKDHQGKLLKITIGETCISAILCLPKISGKFPLLVSFPGAGPGVGKPWISSQSQARIMMTVNVFHYPWSADSAELKRRYDEFNKKIGMSYMYLGGSSPETYFFYPVLLAIVRAIDYASSLPEFDQKHLILSGSSQGGFLAFAAAALTQKATAVCVNVPAMCDHFGRNVGRKPGWPELLKNVPGAEKTAGYFDTVNFAARIKAPVLMAVGYLDRTAPAAGGIAAFNRLQGEKTLLSLPAVGHKIDKAYGEAAGKFINDAVMQE
ncbi:MAG TPA: acetylxylan esterase [Lentisphaeria bacterium]|mgnify:CR=1 FL=1|nr:acetylxylan esterase [Lentisphaeria bacterium]